MIGRKLLRSCWLLLTLTALAGGIVACDMAAKQGSSRDTVTDPLVRERILRRIEEIYSPAKEEAEEVRALAARKECGGVCDKSKRICDASSRVCDLAGDFPKKDVEIHEQCDWSSTDCDSARVACAGCGGPADAAEDEE